MKRIHSSVKSVLFCIFFVVICFAFMILNVILYIKNISTEQEMAHCIMTLISLLASAISLLFLNRFGCFVWFDDKTKELCRKGFFFGFKYKIKVEKIKNIVLVEPPKQEKYIVVIDETNYNYEGLSKKSFIRIEHNLKNLEYIKKFWSEPIKEFKFDELLNTDKRQTGDGSVSGD